MVKRAIIAGVAALLLLAACDTDRGARQDLPNSNQDLNNANVSVYLFPDKFPNLTHKCDATTGMWTDTGRDVWIVYNDPMCDGTGDPMVLDNIPGAKTVSDE